jgi:hypothetical protein
VDEIRIHVAGDLFTAAAHDDTLEAHYACLERPCACLEGWVYLGRTTLTEDSEEEEVIEAVPCGRCTDSR